MKKFFVILVACILSISFTLPAVGADPDKLVPRWRDNRLKFSLGGQVFFRTFWADRDHRAMLVPGGPLAGTWQEKGSDSDLVWERVEPPSRFNVSMQYSDFTGVVEMNSLNDSVNFRRIFGEWNFGVGYLAVGKMWAPTFRGSEVAVRDYGTPGMYGNSGGSEKEDMIRLRFPISIGEIQVAGLRPRFTRTSNITPTATDADSDFKMPKLESSVALRFGFFRMHLSGGYLTYNEVVQVLPAAEKEYDRSASFVQLATGFRTGPFSLKGKIWGSQNPQQYGVACGTNAPIPVAPQRLNSEYFAATDSIEDVNAWGFGASAKYQIIPRKFAVLVGYFEELADRDDPGGLDQNRRSSDLFLQLRFRLTENVMLIPAVGKRRVHAKTQTPIDPPGPAPAYTYSFDGEVEDAFYAGVMWRLVF